MLVLSRKNNESVVVNNNVKVTVVEIRGDKVRLGFTAPKSVPIHREEIFEQIEQRKRTPDVDDVAGDEEIGEA